jgi:hypothetical protein
LNCVLNLRAWRCFPGGSNGVVRKSHLMCLDNTRRERKMAASLNENPNLSRLISRGLGSPSRIQGASRYREPVLSAIVKPSYPFPPTV